MAESDMEMFFEQYDNKLEEQISDSSAEESDTIQKQNVYSARVEKRGS